MQIARVANAARGLPLDVRMAAHGFAIQSDIGSGQRAVAAQLESGVVATVRRCSGTWCRITGSGFDGWIEQERLWGVYPDEKVE